MKLDLSKRYLCADLDHVERQLICTKGANGFAAPDTLRLDALKARGQEVTHTWVSVEDWRMNQEIMGKVLDRVDWNGVKPVEGHPGPVEKPGAKELTTSPVAVDLQYVDVDLAVDPLRYYCQLYDHVQQKQACTTVGYEHVPKDSTHGYHDASAFKKGQRSPYVRYTPPKSYAAQVAEAIVGADDDELVTTGEYLHGKNPNVVTPLATQVAEELAKPENAELLGLVTTDPVEFQDKPSLLTRGRPGAILAEYDSEVKYEDWVLVRAQVVTGAAAGRDFYELRFQYPDGTHFTKPVNSSAIIAKTQSPLPEEPDHGNILISLRDDDGVFWSGQDRETWHMVGTDKSFDWDTVWRLYGPFDEYCPKGRIS